MTQSVARSLVIDRDGDSQVQLRRLPDVRDDDYLVRVLLCGICGSDVHSAADGGRPAGTVIGHEIVGEIAAEGGGFQAGALVAINPVLGCMTCQSCSSGARNLCAGREILGCRPWRPGGLAEFVVVPRDNLTPLKADSTLLEAVATESLAVALHALGRTDPGVEFIVRTGAVAALLALALRRLHGREVPLISRSDRRTSHLVGLGLQVLRATQVRGGSQYGQIIDCVGSTESLGLALAIVPKAGRVVVLGTAGTKSERSWIRKIALSEAVVMGSAQYTDDDFCEAARLIDEGVVETTGIASRVIPIGQAPAVLEDLRSGQETALRVVVAP